MKWLWTTIFLSAILLAIGTPFFSRSLHVEPLPFDPRCFGPVGCGSFDPAPPLPPANVVLFGKPAAAPCGDSDRAVVVIIEANGEVRLNVKHVTADELNAKLDSIQRQEWRPALFVIETRDVDVGSVIRILKQIQNRKILATILTPEAARRPDACRPGWLV